MTLLACLLAASLFAQISGPSQVLLGEDGEAAAEAANDFIQAMNANDPKKLAELGTTPFTFEGRILETPEEIERFWKRALAAGGSVLTHQQNAVVEILDHEGAIEKFDKPPKKFKHLALKKCLFATIALPGRHGYLLILQKQKQKKKKRKKTDIPVPPVWRVTAVTE